MRSEFISILQCNLQTACHSENARWWRVRLRGPRLGSAALPFYVNLATLHVERTHLDDEILKRMLDQGVTFVRDRVVDLETALGKIVSVQSESGARFSSAWFIDASGIGSSLVARKLVIVCAVAQN